MSELVLYRKYRPQTFLDVVGQEHITTLLKNSVKMERMAHAYLFSGPRGTGKTTVARVLAKAANCEKPRDGEPCNVCSVCKEFSSGFAMDLVEIDAASSRGIDEIRELREAVRLSPSHARFKMYIIDEVHMLTREAFSALLKTLEEPPAHAVFILATTELEKVPETIVSRTQHYEFKKVRTAEIVDTLAKIAKKENIRANRRALQLLALFADGGLRDAESMLGQVLAGSNGEVSEEYVRLVLGAPTEEMVVGFVSALQKKDAAQAMNTVQKIVEEGIDPQLYLKMVIQHVREVLLQKLSPKTMEGYTVGVHSSEEIKIIFTHAQSFLVSDLERILKSLLDAYWMGYRAVFPQLPLELAIVDILKPEIVAGEQTKQV